MFVCITGGASALLPAPVGDISIHDLQAITEQLLASGAPIEAVNTIRKHLSRVKGGQLATSIHPAQLITLVVVDEVGGAPWGPTVADSTTYTDAISVLKRYELWSTTPDANRSHLRAGQSGDRNETPTAADLDKTRRQTIVVTDAEDLCRTACTVVEEHGMDALFLSSMIEGESASIGTCLAEIGKEIAASGNPVLPPVIVVSGGETTVTIDYTVGTGGPNQECALAIAAAITETPEITALVIDTDGTDGPTPIGGGLVDASTSKRSVASDINIHEALSSHASTEALTAVDDAVELNPTGTNLMDLRLLMITETENGST